MRELLINSPQQESRDNEIVSPDFKNSNINLGTLYGGDYNDYNDYGSSFDESGYDLPGIIVTPDGNYPENNPWDNGRDHWNGNNQDDDWGFDDFIGGNSYAFTTDNDYSNGMAVLNAMNDSIKNGNALVVEKFSDSNTYKVCNLSSYAGNFVTPSIDLYTHFFGDTDRIAKLGKAFSKSNLIASTALAVITYAEEGEVDWWAIGGIVAGAGAMIFTGTWWVPIVLDGVAILCGAISLANSSTNNSQSTPSY